MIDTHNPSGTKALLASWASPLDAGRPIAVGSSGRGLKLFCQIQIRRPISLM